MTKESVTSIEAQMDKEIDARVAKSEGKTREQVATEFYETPRGQELQNRYQLAFEKRQRMMNG